MDELADDSRSADSPSPLPQDLLRRLPAEPIHLFRASLVSKHWPGLVHDAGFLRRFRDSHGGTPPVLGFFNNQSGLPLFVPTAGAFTAAKMAREDWWALDCRHGRALLARRDPWGVLLVWDLVTGDKRYLPMPPAPVCEGVFNGALLCAAGHGDCHTCPFMVAYLCSPSNYHVCACVYSSETGVWSEITSIGVPYLAVDVKPTALVGNQLYWLSDTCSIFEFDLRTHSLGLTEGIPYNELFIYGAEILIMPTGDGLLGLAGVEGFNLHVWSMVKSIDGVVTWTRERVIDLEDFIAPEVLETCMLGVEPVGFAEEAGMIFIYVHPSIYMIHLKSMQIKEVSAKGVCDSTFPYASFYSPGITMNCGNDQAKLLNNN